MIDIVNQELQESIHLHKKDILVAHKGWYKFSPHIGVGINDFLYEENNDNELMQKVRRNFAEDGMRLKKNTVLDATN